MGFVPTRPGWRGRRKNHPGNGQFRADRAAWPGIRAQSPWCLSRRRFSFYGNFVIADKNARSCGSGGSRRGATTPEETGTDMTDGGLVCESSTSGKRGPTEAAGLRSTGCQRRSCLCRAVWSSWSVRQARLARLHPGSLFPFWRWKINWCATNDFGWRTGHRAPLQPLTATGGGEGNVQVGDGRAERL